MEDGPLNDIPSVAEPHIQQTPIVSPLLAMGVSGPRLGRHWFFGGLVLGALLLVIVLCALLFSARFFLPHQTFFFATVAPSTLNTLLSSEQKSTLPLEWQQPLGTNSRWPVVFGLTGKRGATRAFALGPRWAVPAPLLETTDAKTRALIRQVGVITDKNDAPLVYRELFFDQLFSTGSPQGWLDASFLFPNTSSSQRMRFFVKDRILSLSDANPEAASKDSAPTAPPSSARPLQADASIHLAALQDPSYAEILFGELPLEPIQTTLSSLTRAPATFEMRLTTSTFDALRLTFTEPLRPEERAALVSQLQATRKRRRLILPDGTVAVEQVADETTSSAPSDAHTIDWLAPNATTSLEEVSACGQGIWLARLSPRLLNRFALEGSPLSAWIPNEPIQIWQTGDELVFCLER